MSNLEKAYGKVFKTILYFVNPIKKIFIETLCEVHIFINEQSFNILKNDGYVEACDFLLQYKSQINAGVVWADQDFKSRDHFYNPYSHKGLYGCKTSKYWFEKYYRNALVHWDCKDYDKAMFYLGAALHLVQDATIPQHGSINLLKSHRSYEQWIIKVHDDFAHYAVKDKGLYYESPYHYIDMNAKCAIETYTRYSLIKDHLEKYYKITNITFPLAQRTTAGCMLNFYRRVTE